MNAIDKLRQSVSGMLPRGEHAIYGRAQLEAILAEIDALVRERDEVVLARGMEWMDHAIQVKRERNAAQRELCTLLAGERQRLGVRCTPEEIAASRGWDCFPPDEVQDDVTVAVRRAYGDPVNNKETTR